MELKRQVVEIGGGDALGTPAHQDRLVLLGRKTTSHRNGVAKDYPVVTRAPLTCPRPGCRQYVTRDKDPDYVTCLFHGTVFIAQVPDLDVIPRRGARRSGVVL